MANIKINKITPKDVGTVIDSNLDYSIKYMKSKGYVERGCYISFKFFDKCKVCCFKGLSKHKRSSEVIEELQSFLFKFDQFDNISTAISYFASHNKSKILINSNNPFVKSVWNSFSSNYKDYTGMFDDKSMLHIHTKGGGKGEMLIYGGVYENTLYVLAFGPDHNI